MRAVPKEDKKALQCLEAAGDPEQGLAVLATCSINMEKEEEKYEELHFFTMPYQHPILQIVRRGSCTVEDRYFCHTGWQIKIINLGSTLTKLVPLFAERLAHSHLASWQGTLALDGDGESAALEIDAGKVTVSAKIRQRASDQRRPGPRPPADRLG